LTIDDEKFRDERETDEYLTNIVLIEVIEIISLRDGIILIV